MKDRALNEMVGALAHFAAEEARSRFGDRFRIVNRLTYSSSGGGLGGDVDAVFPLAFSAASEASPGAWDSNRRALFLQSGLSTWEDGHAFRRNDLRYGLVHRHTLSERPGAGVVGVSAWLQENLERGHQRVVAGLDYAGRWGSGSFSYFLPATDWRRARPGYEERAVEGMELGARLDLTTTIDLRAAAGRWEAGDGSGRWETGGRIGLDWRPHPWLTIRGVYGGGARATAGDSAEIMLLYRQPFGGGEETALRWRGLGRLVGGAAPDAAVLWRPFDNVGRIHVVERVVAAESRLPEALSGARVRFLTDSAPTGGTVGVQVTLPAPVSRATRVRVRLMPGSGASRAVPGVDYTDTPIEITIPSGAARGTASVRLLNNPGLGEARTLAVQVYRSAELVRVVYGTCRRGGGSPTAGLTACEEGRNDLTITPTDQSDTIAGAVSVTLGGTVSGTLDSPDDVDYYRLRLTRSGTVTVWVTGEADTVYTLVDGRGTDLSARRAAAPGGAPGSLAATDGARVRVTTDLDDVFVRVTGRRGGRTGSYTVHNEFARNLPPRIVKRFTTVNVKAGGAAASVSLSEFFTDPEGGALTYSASLPAGSFGPVSLGLTVSGSVLSIVSPANLRPGPVSITVTASDPLGLVTVQVLSVTVQPGTTTGGRGDVNDCISVRRTYPFCHTSRSIRYYEPVVEMRNTCSFEVDVRFGFDPAYEGADFISGGAHSIAPGATYQTNTSCSTSSFKPRFRFCASHHEYTHRYYVCYGESVPWRVVN